MPVRDAGDYLSECLMSIQGQLYTHWELLAVDDHSKDGSAEILQSFATRDARIKVLENPGHGIVDALLHAYSICKGTFITRMDADDIMPDHKISALLELANQKNVVATGMVAYFSKQPLGDGFTQYANWLNKLSDEHTHFDEIYKECVVASPAWLTHRSVIEAIGGIAIKDIYPEDYDLVFRWRKHGFRVVASDQLVHLWRDHDTRASRNDSHYADNAFLELKLRHFMEDDNDPNQPLMIWGAGTKGKTAAKWLTERNVAFHWITDNANKVGHTIHGQQLESSAILDTIGPSQLIILVAQPEGQQEIQKRLEKVEAKAYWFC